MQATSVASRRRFVPSSLSILGPRRGAPLLYNNRAIHGVYASTTGGVAPMRARNARSHTVSHATQASTLAGPPRGTSGGRGSGTPPTPSVGTNTRSLTTGSGGVAARVAVADGAAERADQEWLIRASRRTETPSSHSFGGMLNIDAVSGDQPQMTPLREINIVPHKRSEETFAVLDTFPERHLGPRANEVASMCQAIGVDSVRELVEKTIPSSIRTETPLDLPHSNGEVADLEELREMMDQNQWQFRSHLGAGYYPSVTPKVLLRNMLENPSWYTPYTPYQAEISQGRLEMLLNFQTVITDLTALPVANCGLLDESTSAAEAMSMCANVLARHKKNVFLISDACHSQTIAVCRTRAEAVGVDVRVVPTEDIAAAVTKDVCGVLVQYPDTTGMLNDASPIVEAIQNVEKQASKRPLLVAAADLLALTLFRPPGEWGADICVGSAQRFGIPLGFGGPHAGFMSCRSDLARKMPGRIIGVSKDKHGDRALRMALQTREQHIKRGRATSNVCTAQALLANMSAAYACYHGPEGLMKIARHAHDAARTFAVGLELMGFPPSSDNYFDTVHIDLTAHPGGVERVLQAAYARQINIRALDDKSLSVSFDETTQESHIDDLFAVFAEAFPGSESTYDARTIAASLPPVAGIPMSPENAEVEDSNDAHANLHRELLSGGVEDDAAAADAGESFANHHNMTMFSRTSKFLEHPVFNTHHSETDMMRYLYSLERKDLGLNTAMVPLGSCTMKLNAVSEMAPVTWSSVSNMHPFAPEWQTKGYQRLVADMEHMLARVTGFHSVSLQPNSGAQGEFTGLMAIRAYHRGNGDHDRTMCLIPTSAHGTNPASAVMAGFTVVPVQCDDHGNMDLDDLKAKLAENEGRVGAFMVTYPSTHGVFEESIREVCELIHEAGGQVYMDGANLNAQVGYCSPGEIGADVCHLNLHKTFCIPHGGGGPGMGPIGVAEHLAPFLPSHPVVPTGGDQSLGTVAGAPFSSASILPITWMYIRMMSGDGLKAATETAILNANYLRTRLSGAYDVLFTGEKGFCAHEFIIDIRPFAKYGITESDVAKRLQDFSFHAPTMSWPVKGTLMIEPTESEGLHELDRFVGAMLTIREEIQEIIDGEADRDDNVLKNAPHTIGSTMVDEWSHAYSREKAVYPQEYLRFNKFWPSVGRVNESYGDKNFVCTCPGMEEYV